MADDHELAPVALGQRLRDGVGADGAAVSRVSGSAELRRSFHEARLALEAAALGNGSGAQVGSWQDLFPELERRNCRFSTEVDSLR